MEEQENEVLALSSIYEDESKLVFSKHNGEQSGVFYAPQLPKQPLEITVSGSHLATAASKGL